jgi:redox-sensitive bicupin YhaK (pirin superfamily)
MKNFTIISFVFIVSLSCFFVSYAQMTGPERSNWLLGVIFKLENMRDKAIADIQKYKGEIQKCDNTISKSENIVRLAQQKGNVKAEIVAREASIKAQEARIENRDKKNSAELNKKKAEIALATVKNELSNALSQPKKIKSVITNYSGRVSIQKENGEIIDFGENQTSLLEKGDAIVTYGNGSAELQFLEGRGSLKVGEYSKVKMEEDDAGTQVMNMIQGKVNISIEGLENCQKMMEAKIKSYKEDLKTVKDETKQKIVDEYESILISIKKASVRFANKFEVRTGSAVVADRGTQFLVYEDEKKGTEVVVLEGSVEMKGTKGEKTIVINAGYKGAVTKDGKLSEPEKIDLSKMEKWWEK